MARLNLKEYKQRFDEVCWRKFHQPYSPLFASLRQDFSYLRTPGSALNYRHLEKLFHEASLFSRYWQKPDAQLERKLRKEPIPLAPLEGNERLLVERLLGAFRNIGTASIVLNFTWPEHFGIYSTPIVDILQVHRPKLVEAYLEYCNELKVWAKEYKLDNVADTQTALWTWHEIAYDPKESQDSQKAMQQLRADLWIQQRQVHQFLRPLLDRHRRIEVAHIICEEDPTLGGMIAGSEFERLLRLKAEQVGTWQVCEEWDTPKQLDKLGDQNVITWVEKRKLFKLWGIRNRSVHPDRPPTSEEVEMMVDTIREICIPWDRKSAKSRGNR